MKYTVVGRILPERTAAWFGPKLFKTSAAESFLISSHASQISITADLPSTPGYLDAYLACDQLAQAVVAALGFAFGAGYSAELTQVVNEEGVATVFGVKPRELEFEDAGRVFSDATELMRSDILFRLATQDYVRAIANPFECAHYCYRAIEALKSAYGSGATGWTSMHAELGTKKSEIESKVKTFSDPVRHGNWVNFKSTTSTVRIEMLLFTRSILERHMVWRAKNPILSDK